MVQHLSNKSETNKNKLWLHSYLGRPLFLGLPSVWFSFLMITLSCFSPVNWYNWVVIHKYNFCSTSGGYSQLSREHLLKSIFKRDLSLINLSRLYGILKVERLMFFPCWKWIPSRKLNKDSFLFAHHKFEIQIITPVKLSPMDIKFHQTYPSRRDLRFCREMLLEVDAQSSNYGRTIRPKAIWPAS